MGLTQSGNQCRGLLMRQHAGNTHRAFGTNYLAHLPKRLFQHLVVKENQRIECQVLGGGSHLALNGQPGEKGVDLGSAKLHGMTQLMETDEIADPVPVGLLSADAVMMHAHHSPELLLQARFAGGLHGRLPGCVFVQ